MEIVRLYEMDTGFERLMMSFCTAPTNFMQLPLRGSQFKSAVPGPTEQSPNTVAFLGSSDLDGLRAGCRGSDNLVAGDRDDLVGAAARRCWVVEEALR